MNSSQSSITSSGHRILIVEDAIDIRYALERLFASEGYNVALASNGQEALDILNAGEPLPNLILLDLMMPVMDGFKFREEQSKDEKLSIIPVLIMTADGNIAAKTERLGARGYLKKPLDIDDVLDTVASHL